MKITMLHYHLHPGGVTTVIRNAQRALAKRFDMRVLADFGYDEHPARRGAAFLAEARALKRRLESALTSVDVVHTHNLNLGKHPRLTCAVKMLAEKGRIRIINQVHDFAEDDRPAQLHALRFCTGKCDDPFWRAICYYDLPNVRWATLTTRDAAKLAGRGVPETKIHVLPNPVDDECFTQPPPSKLERKEALQRIGQFARKHGYNFDPRRKILLSPMKVMERKNNAEAVELVRRLNALHGRDEYQLLLSLDASSPSDRAYSESLKRKVRREGLPVVLGYGDELTRIVPLFHLAHAILTTSAQEGFGYAFVEGWLCDKLVVGRDIPEVTQDFAVEGMDLRHLYRDFDDSAVQRIAQMLARPPQALIARNRKVVLQKYSLAAYARRYLKLLKQFPRALR